MSFQTFFRFLLAVSLYMLSHTTAHATYMCAPTAGVVVDSVEQPPAKVIKRQGPQNFYDNTLDDFFKTEFEEFDGKAVIGLAVTILGILSTVVISVLGIPVVLIGTILCLSSLAGQSFRKYKRKGKAMAIFGLAIGALYILAILAIIALYAIILFGL